MRSSISRRFWNAWPVFAIGLAFSNPAGGLAQSPRPSGTRPESLRLRTPFPEEQTRASAQPEQIPAPARMSSMESARFDTVPSKSEEETNEVMVIGSANTRVVNASDSTNPIFADPTLNGSDDREVDLSVAVRLSLASMSHLSPWLYWFADPLTEYLREENRTVALPNETAEIHVNPSSAKPRMVIVDDSAAEGLTVPPERIVASDDSSVVVEEERSTRRSETQRGISATSESTQESSVEPPRMTVGESAEEFTPSDTSEKANESSLEAKDISSRKNVSEPIDDKHKRPTPRRIKLPFEELQVDDSATVRVPSSTQNAQPDRLSKDNRPSLRDSESQREQEEPAIDPKTRGSEKELQGVDALNAAKPRTNRRELRTDEGITKRETPNVKSPSIEPLLAARLQRADACFNHYLHNPESTSVRSPWAVMHAVLAYGGEYEMVHGNGRVNAIGWMCHNGTCRTQRMFTPKGRGFSPNIGGGVQGHEGQFLAILAQCNVPLDYPIQIGSSKYTVEDLVRYEMATCKEKSELTFKLIGLSYYLDSNKQWKANDGKVWSIQKLIQEEMAQPIIGSACGGTHRLMGFSFSIRQRQLQGLPVNGQYLRAAKFVREYVAYTLQLQNPDGSFSTSWYEGRANEPNEERKVQTSGHMLEWLMFTMTDEEIKNPKVAKGVDFLLSRIYDRRDYKWPIGPRGHATRAITLYRDRIRELLNSSPAEPMFSATKQNPAPIIRK